MAMTLLDLPTKTWKYRDFVDFNPLFRLTAKNEATILQAPSKRHNYHRVERGRDFTPGLWEVIRAWRWFFTSINLGHPGLTKLPMQRFFLYQPLPKYHTVCNLVDQASPPSPLFQAFQPLTPLARSSSLSPWATFVDAYVCRSARVLSKTD